MKTITRSPTGWVVDDRPVWARVRRWVFSMVERELRNGRLANEGSRLPMGFLGARLIIGHHRIEVRTPWGPLVVTHDGLNLKQVFIASPYPDLHGVHQIMTWLYGAPDDVRKFVETRAVA